jgi:hypothetical protein
VSLSHLHLYANTVLFCSKLDPSVGIEEEFQSYLRVPAIDGEDNVLRWWQEHEGRFPRMARMARQYLAVPASSASVERLFSSVGLVKSDLREKLLDSTTIDIMFAKHNKS